MTPSGLTLFVVLLYALQGLGFCHEVKCYRCFDAVDPKGCSQTAVCGQNEICYTKLFEDHVGKQRYHLGCQDQTVCTLLKTATIIGKRDVTSRKCFDCCSTNECNSNLCQNTVQEVQRPTTTTTTTSSTTTTTTTTTSSTTTTTTTTAPVCPHSMFRSGPLRDTGTIQWRDCSNGNPWIKVYRLDMSPCPLVFHGDLYLTLDATIFHQIADNAVLEVLLEKELLGRYTKVPCRDGFGTCSYDDACHILNKFKDQGSCPVQFTAHGVPCACPFHPMKFHFDKTSFIFQFSNWMTNDFLRNGKYHAKFSLEEKSTRLERACLEFYVNIS